ncbi:hypothetical protein JQ615_18075 [Bradyrhizobium jicamae]|uniref:Uncharacterized protein n=1 Tax=Bradyrhizobium jicamae TaxID=280332 RepID=A0ABS5FKJ5_9BRAD|nr:hypothetical protein [Bradyrhizobium jicamae]MBR0797299.1 hypothetical protein [Bradyrhizobium jicamae]
MTDNINKHLWKLEARKWRARRSRSRCSTASKLNSRRVNKVVCADDRGE